MEHLLLEAQARAWVRSVTFRRSGLQCGPGFYVGEHVRVRFPGFDPLQVYLLVDAHYTFDLPSVQPVLYEHGKGEVVFGLDWSLLVHADDGTPAYPRR